jgi:hypothetical protein
MAATGRTSRGRSVLEWFWRGRALARARAEAGKIAGDEMDLLRRARTDLDLARRALAQEGSPSCCCAAADLFRQAAYWALLARATDLGRPSPQALWAAASERALLEAAAGPDDLASIQPLFESGFVDLADRPPAEQCAAAEQLDRFAGRLLVIARQPLVEVEEVKIQRFFGTSLLVACAVAALMIAMVCVRLITRRPNLAAGKPWTASSEFAKCHPENGECGGTPTEIFFHTKSEDNPWLEYDFGSPLGFSSLTIVNRQDYGPERSVPLVVEVSNDRKTYTEVARRTDVFSAWRPKFAPQQARYLRLRVPRVSFLHLESVEVHR